MNTKDHLIYEFKKLLAEEYERMRNNIAAGSAQNFEQYQRQVGKIQGYAQALEFIDEANEIVEGRASRGN